MEQDYKLELINEFNRMFTKKGWYILVKFDNGDELKVPHYAGVNNEDINIPIGKYRLEQRNEKINKIKCRIN